MIRKRENKLKFEFIYLQYTLIIKTNHLYVLQTITLLKNKKELSKITDAFIVNEEKYNKLNNMLKFFNKKTKKEIMDFLEEIF